MESPLSLTSLTCLTRTSYHLGKIRKVKSWTSVISTYLTMVTSCVSKRFRKTLCYENADDEYDHANGHVKHHVQVIVSSLSILFLFSLSLSHYTSLCPHRRQYLSRLVTCSPHRGQCHVVPPSCLHLMAGFTMSLSLSLWTRGLPVYTMTLPSSQSKP